MPNQKLSVYLASLSAADGDIFVVPTVYRDALAFAPLALDFVKHARATGARLRTPPDPSTVPTVELRNDVWFLPALFFLATTPEMRDSALGVVQNLVSSYLYDRMKGLLPGRRADAQLRIFIKRPEETVEFSYSGPAETLTRLTVPDIVRQLRPLTKVADDVLQLPSAKAPAAEVGAASPSKGRSRGK